MQTRTGQGGGAQDSDGADCRGSGADWKEGTADATAVALGPQAPAFPMGLLMKRLYPSILVLISLGSPGEGVGKLSPSPPRPSPGSLCCLLCLLFRFVAGDVAFCFTYRGNFILLYPRPSSDSPTP